MNKKNATTKIRDLLQDAEIPKALWRKVSAEVVYVLKVAAQTNGKATALKPPSMRAISTITDEKKLEHRREIERAKKARYRANQRAARSTDFSVNP